MTVERLGPARRLVASGCTLGEGPIARSDGAVQWVDIVESRLHRWRDGAHDVVDTPFVPSALGETTDGSLVVATPQGLVGDVDIDRVDSPRLLAALPEVRDGIRMNDGKPDPAGRFVGGTMTAAEPHPPVGSLWSFRDSGPAVELIAGVAISNGLAWSADGATLYFVDTPTHRIDAFDYDVATGAVSARRTVVTIDPAVGDPDGMCIDAEGGLWVALWGGSAVHRFVDGRLAAIVEVPTPYVTCPVFTGPKRDQLVITTAAEPYGAHVPPGAGDVYVVDVGVAGPAPHVVDLARFG